LLRMTHRRMPMQGKMQTLHKLRAIGPEFAAVLVGEIFLRDFNNRRQLASYIGFRAEPVPQRRRGHDQG
jgi:transposase